MDIEVLWLESWLFCKASENRATFDRGSQNRALQTRLKPPRAITWADALNVAVMPPEKDGKYVSPPRLHES